MLIALAASGVLAVALYVLTTMILGDGPGLFLERRLNDPVGYVNGEDVLPLDTDQIPYDWGIKFH